MATKIRVELENAISEGIGQVKKDIQRLDDPNAIDKLVGAVRELEARFAALKQQLGAIEGPDLAKLAADLDAIETRFRGLRKAAQNTLELSPDDLGRTLDAHLQNLVHEARSRFGEIRTEAAETASALDGLAVPRKLEIDSTPLDDVLAKIREIIASPIDLTSRSETSSTAPTTSNVPTVEPTPEASPGGAENAATKIVVDRSDVTAATDAVEILGKTIGDVPATKVVVEDADVRTAKEQVEGLGKTIGDVPDLELSAKTAVEEVNVILGQVSTLSKQASEVNFDGSADGLKELVARGQEATKVVGDLLSAETQTTGALRQTRALREQVEGLAEQTDETRAEIKRLKRDEEQLVDVARLLSGAISQTGDAARTFSGNARAAAESADLTDTELRQLVTTLDRLDRVVSKQQLSKLNRDLRETRTQSRLAAGGSADFIGSLDRQAKAIRGGQGARQQLVHGFTEISQALAVNSVIGNSTVNTLQRLGRAGGTFGQVANVAVGAVIALYGAMEIGERVAKRKKDAIEKLKGELGEYASAVYDATSAGTDFTTQLAASVDEPLENLSLLGTTIGGLRDGFGDLFGLIGDSDAFARLKENLSLAKDGTLDMLFGIDDATRQSAEQQARAGNLLTIQQIRATRDRQAATKAEIESLESLVEVNKRLATLDNAIADGRAKGKNPGDDENFGEVLRQFELLERQREKLIADRRKSEKKAAEEQRKAAEELAKQREEFHEREIAQTKELNALLTGGQKTATDQLIEQRERLAAFGADEETQLQKQVEIVRSLAEERARELATVERLRREQQNLSESGLSSVEQLKQAFDDVATSLNSVADINRRFQSEQQRQEQLVLQMQVKAAEQQRRLIQERGNRLEEIRDLERQIFDLATGQSRTVEQRFNAETKIDDLLIRREAMLKNAATDSKENLESVAEIAREFHKEIGETADESKRLTDELRAMENAGGGTTKEAERLRKKIEQNVELLELLRNRLDQFKESTGSELATAEIDAVANRLSAIEQFLSQQQQQTGDSPLRRIADSVSDRDVNIELAKRRQAELAQKQTEARDQAQKELAAKGVETSVDKNGRLKAKKFADQRDVRRAENEALAGVRKASAQVTPDQRNEVKADLTRDRIDGLEKAGKIDPETAQALRNQLDQTVENIKSQNSLKQSIDNLAEAVSDESLKQNGKEVAKSDAAKEQATKQQEAAADTQKVIDNAPGNKLSPEDFRRKVSEFENGFDNPRRPQEQFPNLGNPTARQPQSIATPDNPRLNPRGDTGQGGSPDTTDALSGFQSLSGAMGGNAQAVGGLLSAISQGLPQIAQAVVQQSVAVTNNAAMIGQIVEWMNANMARASDPGKSAAGRGRG